jgi:hypothetical protein
MSLNSGQRLTTSLELHSNFEAAGVTEAQASDALGVTTDQLAAALNVAPESDALIVWRLRDYLEAEVKRVGGYPVPYTVLTERMRGAAGSWFGV